MNWLRDKIDEFRVWRAKNTGFWYGAGSAAVVLIVVRGFFSLIFG